MIYIATISLPIEADTIEEAKRIAVMAGLAVVPLATGAQPGHEPVRVTMSLVGELQKLNRLNRSIGHGSDETLTSLGLGGEG